MTMKAIIVLCVLFFVSPTVFGQGHTIRGKVRNSAGVNMTQTTVSLESGNGGLINQTVTNNEGDFVFTGLDETSYVVIISMPDYFPVSERVEFVRKVSISDPGEMRTVELTLVRKGAPPVEFPRVNFVQDVPKEALDSFNVGLKLWKENNVPGSMVALQKAITIFPDYFNARFLLATEFIKQEKYSEAIEQLDHARRVNPKDDQVFEAFGKIMMQQRKYAVAARIFAEASQLNPREGQYLLLQGTALIDQASIIDSAKSPNAADERKYSLEEAEKALTRAYQVSGKKLSAVHLQLARVYEKQGQPGRAATELEQYLHETPDDKRAAEMREAIKKLRAAKGSQ